jgi:hypothetical protein
MTIEQLQTWAKTQIDNTARPEVRPDIGVSVLQIVDDLERLKDYVKVLESRSDRVANFQNWISQLPQTGITLADSAFDRETIYE